VEGHPPEVAYRETIVAWSDALTAGNPREANRLFDRQHALAKQLRQTSDGRNVINGLLTDKSPWVRSVAAAHALLWVAERAESILEEFSQDADAPPEVNISAEYTLIEWRAGRLNLDW
jgi:hypothetical protein